MTDEEKEELLAKAKRDYPPGTVYNSCGGWENCVVTGDCIFELTGVSLKHRSKNKTFRGVIHNTRKQQWAEITKQKEIQLNYEIY